MRRLAFHNIWFWGLNFPLVVAWYFGAHESFVNGGGVLYVALVSVMALFLQSLDWYDTAKAAEEQLTVETLVEETELDRA